MEATERRADLLIVGGGLAGLYAALHTPPTARVALIVKGSLEVSNSMWAQGGIAAALAPDDSTALHLADTLVAGRGLCDVAATETLVREGPDDVRHLVALGVPFDRDADGALSLTLEGGHGVRRIAHADGVATGAAVTRTLVALVQQCPHIEIFEGLTAVELLAADGRARGLLAWEAATGRWHRFLAPATILASGGAAGLFARTTNPAVTQGDGVAMAFRAGAEVADLEFVQFHPTALALPGAESFLLSEAIRGEGALLRDSQGERFMQRLHPLAELAPRDVVARGIWQTLRETGSGHVWLDLSTIPRHTIAHHFAPLVERCRAVGLDMFSEPLPVAPAAHYVSGGVRTDRHGATGVAGLFACGEVACTGVQGANRLASNSLLECLVFGRRAAQAATQWASATSAPAAPLPTRLPAPPPNGHAARARARLGQLLWQHAGLVRDAQGVRELLSELDLLEPIVGDSAVVVRLLATAALHRQESRGGHFRRDFPQEEGAWQQRLCFQEGQPMRAEPVQPPEALPVQG